MKITDFTLLKYDRNVITIDTTRTYEQDCSGRKPVGFWFTNDKEYNWKEFCIAEQFALESLKVCNKFRFTEDANILIISDNISFDDFDKKYGVVMDSYGYKTKVINW